MGQFNSINQFNFISNLNRGVYGHPRPSDTTEGLACRLRNCFLRWRSRPWFCNFFLLTVTRRYFRLDHFSSPPSYAITLGNKKLIGTVNSPVHVD